MSTRQKILKNITHLIGDGRLSLLLSIIAFGLFWVSSIINSDILKTIFYLIGASIFLLALLLSVGGLIIDILKLRKKETSSFSILSLILNSIITILFVFLMWLAIFGRV